MCNLCGRLAITRRDVLSRSFDEIVPAVDTCPCIYNPSRPVCTSKIFVRHFCKYILACLLMATRMFCEFLQLSCSSFTNLLDSFTEILRQSCNRMYFPFLRSSCKHHAPWDSRNVLVLLSTCNVYDPRRYAWIYSDFVGDLSTAPRVSEIVRINNRSAGVKKV